ncbi:MAG: hypothetical protein M3383_03945 [Actinomycetota bacterium]|nr:hypothetical protein [Actinomycetota bacterium]
MRKEFLVGVAIFSALAIGGTAVAHEIEHDSTVTVSYAPQADEFRGKVTSPRERCVPGRTVRILRVEDDGSKTLVGKGTTGENGFYAIGYDVPERGKYRARVTREVLRDTKRHTHVCAPDSSPTITVTVAGPPAS